jgi:hypothetical protein
MSCLSQNGKESWTLPAQHIGHVHQLLHGHRQDTGALHYTERKLQIGKNVNNESTYDESHLYV